MNPGEDLPPTTSPYDTNNPATKYATNPRPSIRGIQKLNNIKVEATYNENNQTNTTISQPASPSIFYPDLKKTYQTREAPTESPAGRDSSTTPGPKARRHHQSLMGSYV